MFEAFSKFVEAEFLKKEISFFLGGSRRFGYHSEDSDFDYFVLKEPRIALILTKMGFDLIKSDYKMECHFRMKFGHNSIDVILLDSTEYHLLLIRHQQIEDEIKEKFSPEALKFLRDFKRRIKPLGVTGSHVFESLRITL